MNITVIGTPDALLAQIAATLSINGIVREQFLIQVLALQLAGRP